MSQKDFLQQQKW